MKKMLFAIVATTLFASCSKKESVQPVATPNTANNVAIESVSRIPPWDLTAVSYVQGSGPRNSPIATVGFSISGGGAGGSGNIWVASCNSSNQITGNWQGPFASSSYSAVIPSPYYYVPGVDKMAIFFDPGGVLGTGGPLFLWSGYGIGYTVNSITPDAMDVAVVQ